MGYGKDPDWLKEDDEMAAIAYVDRGIPISWPPNERPWRPSEQEQRAFLERAPERMQAETMTNAGLQSRAEAGGTGAVEQQSIGYGGEMMPNPYVPNPYAPNPYAPNPYAPNPYAPNSYAPTMAAYGQEQTYGTPHPGYGQEQLKFVPATLASPTPLVFSGVAKRVKSGHDPSKTYSENIAIEEEALKAAIEKRKSAREALKQGAHEAGQWRRMAARSCESSEVRAAWEAAEGEKNEALNAEVRVAALEVDKLQQRFRKRERSKRHD